MITYRVLLSGGVAGSPGDIGAVVPVQDLHPHAAVGAVPALPLHLHLEGITDRLLNPVEGDILQTQTLGCLLNGNIVQHNTATPPRPPPHSNDRRAHVDTPAAVTQDPPVASRVPRLNEEVAGRKHNSVGLQAGAVHPALFGINFELLPSISAEEQAKDEEEGCEALHRDGGGQAADGGDDGMFYI